MGAVVNVEELADDCGPQQRVGPTTLEDDALSLQEMHRMAVPATTQVLDPELAEAGCHRHADLKRTKTRLESTGVVGSESTVQLVQYPWAHFEFDWDEEACVDIEQASQESVVAQEELESQLREEALELGYLVSLVEQHTEDLQAYHEGTSIFAGLPPLNECLVTSREVEEMLTEEEEEEGKR